MKTDGLPSNDDGLDDPPSSPPDPVVVKCEITTPKNGDTIAGPWNGVTIPISGTTSIKTGKVRIDSVEVSVDGAPFKPATPTSGTSWAAWTASQLVEHSGTVDVTARVLRGSEPIAERTITVTTSLAAKPAGNPPPPADTTPPSVSIDTPKNGITLVLSSSNQVDVAIAGTAADQGSGIKEVVLEVDGAPIPVTKEAGTWDKWSARTPLVGTGTHTLTARAIDNAGLEMASSIRVSTSAEPLTPPVVERLLLVEKLRLSTFLGAYGPGRTIKTLSLLPGEKTTIAVKSFRRTSQTSTESSSVLDSYTTDSQDDFESSLNQEQSNKQTSSETSSWNVSGKADASWGWGSASISAGATGGSNASREELAKNISNAVHKHAAKASSKRDVEVKSSREMKQEEGEEFSSESHIENINVSRTLNFIFRQMNQEFITLLHLVDIRIAYVRGDLAEVDGQETVQYTYREVTLSQLDGLLSQVVVEERRDDVRREILKVLRNVFDYEDEQHMMVEERILLDDAGNPIPNGSYLRVPKGKISTYKDPTTGTEILVPGVILSAMKNVMRTDGVLCDALLGQGIALDAYSQGLQKEAVEARTVETERQRAALHKDQLAMKLIKDRDEEGAKIFKEVYPTPESESLALVTTSAHDNGAGG